MNVVRLILTFLLGLLLAHYALSWADAAGLIPENFRSLETYDNLLTLATFVVYPLAWASAWAVVRCVVPEWRAGGAATKHSGEITLRSVCGLLASTFLLILSGGCFVFSVGALLQGIENTGSAIIAATIGLALLRLSLDGFKRWRYGHEPDHSW